MRRPAGIAPAFSAFSVAARSHLSAVDLEALIRRSPCAMFPNWSELDSAEWSSGWTGTIRDVKVRKRVESIFGWMKTVGGFCRSLYRGVERTRLCGELVATAYNLVRMSRLIAEEESKVPIVA